MFLKGVINKGIKKVISKGGSKIPQPEFVPREELHYLTIDQVAMFGLHEEPCKAMAFDAIQRNIIIGTSKGNIMVINFNGYECLIAGNFPRPFTFVNVVVNSGKVLAIDTSNCLQMFDLKTRSRTEKVANFHFTVTCAYSPDAQNKTLVNFYFLGTSEGSVEIFNIAEFKLTSLCVPWKYATCNAPESSEPSAVNAIKVSNRDNNLLLVGYNCGIIILWDLKTSKLNKTLYQPDVTFTQVDLNVKGKILATGTEDGQVMIWKLKDKKPCNVFSPAEVPLNTNGSTDVSQEIRPIENVIHVSRLNLPEIILTYGGCNHATMHADHNSGAYMYIAPDFKKIPILFADDTCNDMIKCELWEEIPGEEEKFWLTYVVFLTMKGAIYYLNMEDIYRMLSGGEKPEVVRPAFLKNSFGPGAVLSSKYFSIANEGERIQEFTADLRSIQKHFEDQEYRRCSDFDEIQQVKKLRERSKYPNPKVPFQNPVIDDGSFNALYISGHSDGLLRFWGVDHRKIVPVYTLSTRPGSCNPFLNYYHGKKPLQEADITVFSQTPITSDYKSQIYAAPASDIEVSNCGISSFSLNLDRSVLVTCLASGDIFIWRYVPFRLSKKTAPSAPDAVDSLPGFIYMNSINYHVSPVAFCFFENDTHFTSELEKAKREHNMRLTVVSRNDLDSDSEEEKTQEIDNNLAAEEEEGFDPSNEKKKQELAKQAEDKKKKDEEIKMEEQAAREKWLSPRDLGILIEEDGFLELFKLSKNESIFYECLFEERHINNIAKSNSGRIYIVANQEFYIFDIQSRTLVNKSEPIKLGSHLPKGVQNTALSVLLPEHLNLSSVYPDLEKYVYVTFTHAVLAINLKTREVIGKLEWPQRILGGDLCMLKSAVYLSIIDVSSALSLISLPGLVPCWSSGGSLLLGRNISGIEIGLDGHFVIKTSDYKQLYHGFLTYCSEAAQTMEHRETTGEELERSKNIDKCFFISGIEDDRPLRYKSKFSIFGGKEGDFMKLFEHPQKDYLRSQHRPGAAGEEESKDGSGISKSKMVAAGIAGGAMAATMDARLKLDERGEKINNLNNITEDMNRQADDMLRTIQEYNRKQAQKKWYQL